MPLYFTDDSFEKQYMVLRSWNANIMSEKSHNFCFFPILLLLTNTSFLKLFKSHMSGLK